MSCDDTRKYTCKQKKTSVTSPVGQTSKRNAFEKTLEHQWTALGKNTSNVSTSTSDLFIVIIIGGEQGGSWAASLLPMQPRPACVQKTRGRNGRTLAYINSLELIQWKQCRKTSVKDMNNTKNTLNSALLSWEQQKL